MLQVVEGDIDRAEIDAFLYSLMEFADLELSSNPFECSNVIDFEAFRQARHGESDI